MSCDLIKVHVWPDGTWCDEENLEDYLSFMSDDYRTISLTPCSYEKLCTGDDSCLAN